MGSEQLVLKLGLYSWIDVLFHKYYCGEGLEMTAVQFHPVSLQSSLSNCREYEGRGREVVSFSEEINAPRQASILKH